MSPHNSEEERTKLKALKDQEFKLQSELDKVKKAYKDATTPPKLPPQSHHCQIRVTKRIKGARTGTFEIGVLKENTSLIDPGFQTFSRDGEQHSWKVEPGTYTVVEKDPGPQWSWDKLVETVEVSPTSPVDVVFTSTYAPGPHKGGIRVTTVFKGDPAEDFDITVNHRSLPFHATGDNQTWSNLPPGDYDVEFETKPGWTHDIYSAVDTDGRPIPIEQLILHLPQLKPVDPPIPVDREIVSLFVVFTKTHDPHPDKGSILVRSIQNGSTATFDFKVKDSGGKSVCSGKLSGDGATYLCSGLQPSSYTVALTTKAGWTPANPSQQVNVEAGKTASAEFTSTFNPVVANGFIEVTVSATGGTSPPSFDVEINGNRQTISVTVIAPTATGKASTATGKATWSLTPGPYKVKAVNVDPAWNIPPEQTVPVFEGRTSLVKMDFTPFAGNGAIQVTNRVIGAANAPYQTPSFQIYVGDVLGGSTKEFHGDNAQNTWSGLKPGTYDIIESNPGPGWIQAPAQKVTLIGSETVKVVMTNIAAPEQLPLKPDQLQTAVNSALAGTNEAITKADRRLRDIAASGGQGSGGGRAGGGTDGIYARKKVDQALARVLGRSVGSDPHVFQAAVRGAFPEDKATGEIVRRPVRSYVGSDGGSKQLAAHQDVLRREIQAIVEQAGKELAAIEQALPRFTGTNREAEEAKALVKLIQSDLDRLVDEVNRVDRPRRPRVDVLVNALLEQHASLSNMANVNRQATPTPEEEQLDAGLQLLGRHIDGLNRSFEHYNTAAGPGGDSVTVQLAAMDLLFGNVLQAVDDLRAAMDAVGLSQIECRTATIEVDGETISIEDILSWIESLAETEGPELIASGGRWGLRRVRGAAQSVQHQVETLYLLSQTDPAPHVGFTYQTVQDALAELVGSVGRLAAAPDRQAA